MIGRQEEQGLGSLYALEYTMSRFLGVMVGQESCRQGNTRTPIWWE
jgi:hypothetical protein